MIRGCCRAQDALAQGRRRIDLRYGSSQPRRNRGELTHVLPALGTRRHVRLERAALRLAQHAERVPAGQVAKLVVGHRRLSV